MFGRLNNSRVMRPANALQIVQIKEQVRVAFVRFDVVNHGRVRMLNAAPQDNAASLMLAAESIAEQCLFPQDAPLLGLV